MRFDVSGAVGVIAQRLPKFADRYAEAAVKIDIGIFTPQAVSKFLPADDFSGVFEERDEEPIGLLLKLYAPAVLQQFAGGDVHLKGAKLIDSSGMCLHTCLPNPPTTQ